MSGQEAYVLCGGTVENKKMEASFSTDDGFRIINTLAFADTISRYIPGFIAGMEGLCAYRRHLLIEEHEVSPIKPPGEFKDPEEWGQEYDHYVAEKSKKAFFLKHLKYSHQGEYRFVWFAAGESERDHIDIVCSEATKYCQRLPRNAF